MLQLFAKVHWVIVDCLTGQAARIEQFPFELGSGDGVDFKLNGASAAERHCVITQAKGKGLRLAQQDGTWPVVLNGTVVEVADLAPEQDYAVRIGTHFLALRGSKQHQRWLRGLDHTQWTLVDAATQQTDGPMGLEELCRFAQDRQRHPETLVQPKGLTAGFLLRDALELVEALRAQAEAAAPQGLSAEEETFTMEPGLLTCPVCWLKFDAGDIMHVAVHDSLRGDPILGEDAQQRFLATRFNDRGQALDALGLPCTDMACPMCRRVLPPAFAEMRHHIFSIVGDQSAGKSYYLSVLLKMLPASLFDKFSVVFQDADPTNNAAINEMKKTLFGAQTPEQARLVKTQLEGAMYERFPRYGRMVALPRPFVFFLAATSEPAERKCSVIFYDNAGEHFQPGRDSADSPGAQHVASSSGILFLFDPFNNPEFRRRMADRADPQMEKPVIDQQDIILSEMKVRIKKLIKLRMVDKVDMPLAVLVGKCDAWMHLLGDEPFRHPVTPGRLDLEAVRYNSEKVRTLLRDICPSVVANAESIAHRVMFFPVSSFGHAPVRVGPNDFVPDPRQLRPFLVEVPPLWILSQITPELVPS